MHTCWYVWNSSPDSTTPRMTLPGSAMPCRGGAQAGAPGGMLHGWRAGHARLEGTHYWQRPAHHGRHARGREAHGASWSPPRVCACACVRMCECARSGQRTMAVMRAGVRLHPSTSSVTGSSRHAESSVMICGACGGLGLTSFWCSVAGTAGRAHACLGLAYTHTRARTQARMLAHAPGTG